jgi:hypothetical protein
VDDEDNIKMDRPVAGGERMDCGMGWAEVAGGCEHDKRLVPQNAGNFSRNSRTNKSVSKDSAPWRWLGLN